MMLGLSLQGPSFDFRGGVLGECKAASVWHGIFAKYMTTFSQRLEILMASLRMS